MIYHLCGVSPQGAAANPDSEEQQQKLREAAEGLRMATNAAAQNAIKKRLVNKLEVRWREEVQKYESLTYLEYVLSLKYGFEMESGQNNKVSLAAILHIYCLHCLYIFVLVKSHSMGV